ncbi:MAG: ABC transporter ATP-binding protein [Alphaproteobacteria bacterium]
MNIPTNISTWSLVKRLNREHIRKYYFQFLIALIFMALVAASTAALAWLMAPVINDVLGRGNRDTLFLISFVVLGTFIVKGISSYAQSSIMSYVSQSMVADIQKRLYRHVLMLDLAFFQSQKIGGLVSRVANDANLLRSTIANILTSLGLDFLTLIFLIAVMFYRDWLLACITFVAFPLAVVPVSRLGRRMRKATTNMQHQVGLLTGLLTQSFAGIRHVKAYAMEAYEIARADRVIDQIFASIWKGGRTRAIASPLMEVLGGLAISIVIIYGGLSVIEHHRTAGDFISFITAVLMAYEPMKRLANLYTSLQEGMAAASRIFTILDCYPTLKEHPQAQSLPSGDGSVTLENVSFSYDRKIPALHNVSVTVKGGQKVAFVGPSGAGKSTILNLISRFYDPTSGRILIDGYDIRYANFTSLREKIAWVSQEIGIFDDTVRANIAYGKPDATDSEVETAARHAAAHNFIVSLPDGYATPVGEQGIKLSGGQRQRIAIARAMLKNAPILLLDEATAALDTESERHVQIALDALMEGRTTIVIAHRLTTVAKADLIFVLDKGEVVEMGSHDVLLKRGGLYAHLYEMQFANT